MILAIDGYEANETNRVGIGEYSFQIVSHVYKQLSLSKNNDVKVRIYLPAKPISTLPEQQSFWEYKIRMPKKMWTFGALPVNLLIDRPKADVVFSPTHYIPRFSSIPRTMSIMDLSFLYYPELFRKKDYYQLVNWTKYSVRHARAIFTISEFSRNAIIKAYAVSPEKVITTYPGFIENKMKSNLHHDVLKKFTISSPYILSVGTIQPRKNYRKLIEAFARLKQHKEYNDVTLVIVGKKGWLFESILSAPDEYHIKDSVRFLDFVTDEDLGVLYREATCFVLPSLYEGFGLPVLEAMANTCSIVVSNVSSLPEIAGDAAIYIEPEQIESIVEGLERALKEHGTEKEKKRLAIGKERVKLFSWDKAAEKTLEILEKVGRGEL